MRKLMPVIVVALAVWAWQRMHKPRAETLMAAPAAVAMADAKNTAFKCDGRQYCSQMTSCAEATYYLRNCPNVKMDGNHDGVPCEMQWCK